MTTQKALKRRVRTRMSKTGEAYAAARRQVLARAPEPEPPAEEAAPSPAEAARTGTTRTSSDEAVLARTGRRRAEWFALLDAWGAADRSHRDIARWLATEHEVDGWWAQEVTVDYERAIGRRQVGEHLDGFSITVSRTIGVPVERLFDAFVEADLRARWLPDVELTVRTATPHRTARFDVGGGPTRLAIGFTAKGPDRSTVAMEHARIPDADAAERWKASWRDRFADLKGALEGADVATAGRGPAG